MCKSAKSIAHVLKAIFPSTEMSDYLAVCPVSDDMVSTRAYVFDDAPPEKLPLRRHRLADAIAGAPISLERKLELLAMLAEEEETPYFAAIADKLKQAIQDMQPKQGEFLYLKSCCYHESGCAAKDGLGPYLTWERLFDCVREFMRYLNDDKSEDDLIWFEVEKWFPDGDGGLQNDFNCTILGTEICYFFSNMLHDRDLKRFESYRDLNLPVPFHAGDIVTVDCRPFEPVRHVVILEIGDNCDCCCLQALHRKGDGIWDIGAVKHGHVFPTHPAGFSPLYRMETFHGQLPEEERLLEKVSRYINGDESRGAALWKYIYSLCDELTGEYQVTEEQILSYISVQ